MTERWSVRLGSTGGREHAVRLVRRVAGLPHDGDEPLLLSPRQVRGDLDRRPVGHPRYLDRDVVVEALELLGCLVGHRVARISQTTGAVVDAQHPLAGRDRRWGSTFLRV